MRSILQDKKSGRCYICENWRGDDTEKRDLEEHHIFFGTGKKWLSDEDGLIVHLCPEHHREGPAAVHKNRLADLYVKAVAQAKYEETHTRDEFIRRYGKSYL